MKRMIANSLFKEDESFKQEMRDTFHNSSAAVKYIKALNVSDEVIEENLVKIYDFTLDLQYCKKCPGLDACNKETPRLCTKIVYREGKLDRQLVPCKKYLDYVNFKRQFVVRDFPEDNLKATLKNIDQTGPRLEAIKKYKEILETQNGEWLFINGEEGTGRSYLASLITVDLAKNKKGPVAFLDVPTRFKEIGSKKDDAFNNLITQYSTVPVLVLDDLGNEYKSDFVRETILFPILNNRSKNGLFTIITSDFSIDDIALMYQTNIASKPKVEQIKRLLKKKCPKEINLGNISVY